MRSLRERLALRVAAAPGRDVGDGAVAKAAQCGARGVQPLVLYAIQDGWADNHAAVIVEESHLLSLYQLTGFAVIPSAANPAARKSTPQLSVM